MPLALLLLVLSLLIAPSRVHSASSPTQLTPLNNSQASSSKLTWEAPIYPLYSINPYRVQVDDNSDFSSVYRDYTTKNTYYTPVLTDGTWFWRIKAKDSGALWSDWSTTWSFSLLSSPSSPSPTPEPESASASSSPNPSSSFSISAIPTEITSEETVDVSVNLSLPSKPNTLCYLKGAFRHSDSPNNYFGLTKVDPIWVKNSASATEQLPVTTDQNGNWAGVVEVQTDPEDSGFVGTGNYLFKIGYYTSTGSETSSVSWGNEVGVKITQTTTTQNQELVSSTSTTTNSTSPTTSSEPTGSPNKTQETSVKESTKQSPKETQKKNSVAKLLEEVKVSPLGTILGTNSASSSSSTTNQPKSLVKGLDVKSLLLIGLGIIIAILGIVSAFGKNLTNLWTKIKH